MACTGGMTGASLDTETLSPGEQMWIQWGWDLIFPFDWMFFNILQDSKTDLHFVPIHTGIFTLCQPRNCKCCQAHHHLYRVSVPWQQRELFLQCGIGTFYLVEAGSCMPVGHVLYTFLLIGQTGAETTLFLPVWCWYVQWSAGDVHLCGNILQDLQCWALYSSQDSGDCVQQSE